MQPLSGPALLQLSQQPLANLQLLGGKRLKLGVIQLRQLVA
jgi:hypothetical protein